MITNEPLTLECTPDQMCEYFKSQLKFVKELSVIKSYITDESLLDFIRERRLTKLEIETKRIAKCPDILFELAKYTNWRKISFMGTPFGCETIKMIFSSHPSKKFYK